MPRGFRAAGIRCGIKASDALDLALIVADAPCAAAGVLTRNRFPGEPIRLARRRLRSGSLRAIVCNSGIANVATGRAGMADAMAMAGQVADAVGCPASQVLPFSTGLIGHRLPMPVIERGIEVALTELARGPRADAAAARAILTTDLVPKSATRRLRVGRTRISLAGIAKGSGMIAPDLATMLVFLTTDAAVSPTMLRSALRSAVADSFNRISVDGHTSPSDAVLVLASGAAGGAPLRGGAGQRAFGTALADLCADLARQIVEDGEGATRVFRVHVSGARSRRDADRIGRAVVNSPLVKTAVHGADPNWGRVVTAAGHSGAALDPARLSLTIGADEGVCVFERGAPVEPGPREAARLKRVMRRREVVFHLRLGLGRAETQWLGCDLSARYVAINADYTT